MPKPPPTYAERNELSKPVTIRFRPARFAYLEDRAGQLGTTIAGYIQALVGQDQLDRIEKDKGGK